MARLPSPGNDEGNWGAILNEYLKVALNDDGTVKDTGVVADKYEKPSGGIPESDLTGAVQTKLNSGAPDADSGTKGVVQLTGDLGGTAASPTVPGLSGKVAKAGDTMSGNLNMDGSQVTNLGTTTNDGDAATKSYVDTLESKTVPESGGVPMRDPNLTALYADLDDPTTIPVDIVIIGDSIAALGWVELMQENLATRYNNYAGAINPIAPFSHASSSALFAMTSANANTQDATTFAGYGVGLTDGQSVAHTATCDGVIVLWGENTGTLTVKDGGSGGTTVATIDTSTGDGGSNITSINLTTYASHNVWIGSTGNTTVDGVFPTVGNRTVGVRVWRCANPGDATTHFLNAPARGLDFIEHLAAHTGREPHVVLATGYNDTNADTYDTDMRAMVAAVQARTNGSIAIWATWGVIRLDKAKKARTIATELGVGLIDAQKAFGNISNNSDPNELSGDGAHPSGHGNNALALQAEAVLSGDPIGTIIPIIPKWTTFNGDSFTINKTTSGSIQLSTLFGFPYLSLKNNNSDAQSQMVIYTSTVTALLGGPSSAVIGFGPGGASSIDTYIARWTANTFGVSAGGAAMATTMARLGGTLTRNTTNVGNVGTGEDDLMTYSVPANTLNTNNHSISFRATGTIANNANSKQVKVYFGSDQLFATGALPTSAAGEFVITGEIIRTGAATQKASVEIRYQGGSYSGPACDLTSPTRTLSSANILKLTGEAVADNDIIQNSFSVEFKPA